MTDYTSSIGATLFPSTAEDEERLAALKKGTWVKAYGNIEINKFSQELNMIVRDMNKVEHIGRLDRAPEDQKRSRSSWSRKRK